MIYDIKDVAELQRKAMLKQIIEAQLAQGIYAVFNRGDALKKLQDMAGIILQRMGADAHSPFSKAVAEEKNLRLFKSRRLQDNQAAFSLWGQSAMLRKRLDASDCADLIRLAGAWVENGGLANVNLYGVENTDWQKHQPIGNTLKEAYRAGVGGGSSKTQVENVWSDGKGRFANVAGKKRDRGDGWAIESHVRALTRAPGEYTGMAGLMINGKRVGSKRLHGDSTILKLDNLYGLLKGCDISGTTTDCVFALEIFGGEVGLSSGYYLLPLGTIVHNMHHTVIEVGMALTLTHCVDYHIGFFSTLAPTTPGGLASELAPITGLLNAAEQEMKQKSLHFLNYYQGHTLKGAFLITGEDIPRFRNSNLSHSKTMLDKARYMINSPYPNKLEVTRLIQRYLPGAKLQ